MKLSLLLLFVRIHAYIPNTYILSEDNLHMSSNDIILRFPDGSNLLRFYRPIDECFEPNLHLKLLHRNGTVSSFNIQNLSIPRLNFCKTPSLRNNYSDYIYTSIVGVPDIFYIFYYNISESDPDAPFGRLLLEINLKEEILR